MDEDGRVSGRLGCVDDTRGDADEDVVEHLGGLLPAEMVGDVLQRHDVGVESVKVAITKVAKTAAAPAAAAQPGLGEDIEGVRPGVVGQRVERILRL